MRNDNNNWYAPYGHVVTGVRNNNWYAPCDHVVTGDVNIVRNEKHRDLLREGPKYREPASFSWHQNVDIIMDACEAYTRQLAKKGDAELDTLSEWI